MTTPAGELRHRIMIEENTPTTRTAHGGVVDAWEEVAETLAKISSGGGREFYQARQMNTALTHEITIRYRSGITPQMRVKYEDPKSSTTRYFNILSVVNPNEGREELQLQCEERNAGASDQG